MVGRSLGVLPHVTLGMIFQVGGCSYNFWTEECGMFSLLGRSPHLESGEITPIYKPFRPFWKGNNLTYGDWGSPWDDPRVWTVWTVWVHPLDLTS